MFSSKPRQRIRCQQLSEGEATKSARNHSFMNQVASENQVSGFIHSTGSSDFRLNYGSLESPQGEHQFSVGSSHGVLASILEAPKGISSSESPGHISVGSGFPVPKLPCFRGPLHTL